MFTVYLSATCYFAGFPNPIVGISPYPFQARLKDCFVVTKVYPAVICNDADCEHEITVIMAKKASENIDLLFRLVDQVNFTHFDNFEVRYLQKPSTYISYDFENSFVLLNI